jgi:hypothetical protein
VFSTFFAQHPTPTCPNEWISTKGVSPKQYAVVAGIPMLQDLLNADSEQVAIDEDALFNHPDPYGMEDLEAMEEG